MRQFFKFCLVGLSNAAVSLLTYYACIFWGFHYIGANIISWVVGVFNSFYWNNRYVFASVGKWWIELLKSYVSYGFSLIAGLLLMWWLIEIMGMSEFLAPVIVMAVMTPVNFALNKLWVFGRGSK